MKQIEVQIMGQSYLLGCPEDGEERLRIAVEKVDSAMCSIRDHGKIRARDRIAVLAALNLAFDLTDRQAAAAANAAVNPYAAHASNSSVQNTPAAAATVSQSASAVASAQQGQDHEPQLELLLTKLDQALAEPDTPS